jgi:hypothetical protein
MASGEVGGARETSTYILLANTSPAAGDVAVSLVIEDGTTLQKQFTVAGSSRFNVDVAFEFPASRDRRFGAVVEALGASPVPLVVECAMYWNAGGVRWAAGTDAVATPLSAEATQQGGAMPAGTQQP